jgi:hypothetical protein
MDTMAVVQSIYLLIAAIVFLATASIGLEAYNADSKLREEKKSNYNFLAVGAGMSALTILLSAYWLYQSWNTRSASYY